MMMMMIPLGLSSTGRVDGETRLKEIPSYDDDDDDDGDDDDDDDAAADDDDGDDDDDDDDAATADDQLKQSDLQFRALRLGPSGLGLEWV